MQRYLLFDSGCAVCSKLAQDIERETNGVLVARSLRESQVQALLNQARPGWRWEPTLLEVQGEHARAFTGVKMRARLVAKLGLKRAWRVAQLVRNIRMPANDVNKQRRQLLQYGGVAGMALLFGGIKLPGTGASSAATTEFTLADANKALALVLGSEELHKLRELSARSGLHLNPVRGRMQLLTTEQGLPVYGGEKHSVLYIGKYEGAKVCQVALGFEETGNERNFSVVVAYVNLTTQEVSRVTRIAVDSMDEQNGVVTFHDTQGNVVTYVVKDGRAQDMTAASANRATGGGKLFAPMTPICGGALGCWIAEQVACLTMCTAIAGASLGIGGVPCGIVCSAGFLWLCSYAPC